MDNITHTLFALTLANTGLRRAGRGATAALVIASSVPDIEIVTAFTGGRAGYLAAHRGPTHGPLGFALALATGAVVWLAVRLAGRKNSGVRPAARLGALVALSSLGVAGHIAMDFATSYGTRVLSPFTQAWMGVDWMPIVDLVLWAILTAGVVAGALSPERRARFAAVALLLAAGDYTLRASAHEIALTEAVAIQARTVPGPAARPRTVFHYLHPADPAALPAALPTLGSPFRWRLITRTPLGFRVQTLDLFGRSLERDAIDFPNDSGPLVARAETAAIAAMFLQFSRFPAADQIRHTDGRTTVHWYDLRFAEPPPAAGDRRYTSPFAVWIRLSPAGEIIGQGLGPG